VLDANNDADVFLVAIYDCDLFLSLGPLVLAKKSNRLSQPLDRLASALLGFYESAVHARDPTIFTSWLKTFSTFRVRRRLVSRICYVPNTT
jgi:hypothetical protein